MEYHSRIFWNSCLYVDQSSIPQLYFGFRLWVEPTATDSDCWRLVHSFTRSGESARALSLSRTANALVLQLLKMSLVLSWWFANWLCRIKVSTRIKLQRGWRGFGVSVQWSRSTHPISLSDLSDQGSIDRVRLYDGQGSG